MEDNTPKAEREPEDRRRAETNSSMGGTIAGFMLFLTGALMVLYGLLDIVVRMNSLLTAGYLVVGLLMYKFGQYLLNHFAVFKVQRERRRAPPRHT
ncbi:hypothetical protein Q4561_07275 [Alteromonas sp. 1_MG-2023]|uniref:hypothetical protein n=1 Tax=Alteromonas sp. 1_MG-2023 TaxID=3062669 RepID=UPI0026E19282|nr:hypothetical protein [Alteromonas sp. 1_MG-2023]MDO6566855.1 hypothetical protein [Alteromonas sp. 1_MG-2023]